LDLHSKRLLIKNLFNPVGVVRDNSIATFPRILSGAIHIQSLRDYPTSTTYYQSKTRRLQL
jgi:hypothetical protein